jgi:RNA polymerase sigma factor (sigma-70 family)
LIEGSAYEGCSQVRQLEDVDIAEGRRGFHGRLRRKGFSPQFIEDFGEDLFAEAQVDVLEVMAKGVEVHTPPALLIHCAWRRTQDLLDRRRRRPQSVSTEAVCELAGGDSNPDEQLLATELRQRMHKAMSYLPPAEQKILELMYFEEMTCREAGRYLGWSSSHAQRKHEVALRRLRPFFARTPLERVEFRS